MLYGKIFRQLISTLFVVAILFGSSVSYAEIDNELLSEMKLDAADKLIDTEDYNGALELINEAINLTPDNEMAYCSRGDVYFYLEKYDLAFKDYDKAVKLDPECSLFYANRGDASIYLDRYEDALKDLNKAIQLESDNGYYYQIRAEANYYLERYNEALADINKAIELDPDGWYNKELRGYIMEAMESGAPDAALSEKIKEGIRNLRRR